MLIHLGTAANLQEASSVALGGEPMLTLSCFISAMQGAGWRKAPSPQALWAGGQVVTIHSQRREEHKTQCPENRFPPPSPKEQGRSHRTTAAPGTQLGFAPSSGGRRVYSTLSYNFGAQQIINPVSEVTKAWSHCLFAVFDYYKVVHAQQICFLIISWHLPYRHLRY